ncbi:MAG: hypothetical protein NVSMB6_20320 [Burkholderiaceae bacterium]
MRVSVNGGEGVDLIRGRRYLHPGAGAYETGPSGKDRRGTAWPIAGRLLDCLVLAREAGLAAYHICGTCRMEPNSEQIAMVDNELRVRGLRAADASITSCVPSANTSAAAFLIAEKALDDDSGAPIARCTGVRRGGDSAGGRLWSMSPDAVGWELNH